MLINVTHKDIHDGNAAIDACPITLALRRYFSNKISVSRDFIRVAKKRGKGWNLVPLPANAKRFILNYHVYRSSEPFSFELSRSSVKVLKG